MNCVLVVHFDKADHLAIIHFIYHFQIMNTYSIQYHNPNIPHASILIPILVLLTIIKQHDDPIVLLIIPIYVSGSSMVPSMETCSNNFN